MSNNENQFLLSFFGESGEIDTIPQEAAAQMLSDYTIELLSDQNHPHHETARTIFSDPSIEPVANSTTIPTNQANRNRWMLTTIDENSELSELDETQPDTAISNEM